MMAASWTTFLALLGKLCIAGAFTVVYIISGEVFATSIRNSALGVVSAIARVGAMVAPFIVMLGETSPGLQFFIFGLFCVLGASWALAFPRPGASLCQSQSGKCLSIRRRRSRLSTSEMFYRSIDRIVF